MKNQTNWKQVTLKNNFSLYNLFLFSIIFQNIGFCASKFFIHWCDKYHQFFTLNNIKSVENTIKCVILKIKFGFLKNVRIFYIVLFILEQWNICSISKNNTIFSIFYFWIWKNSIYKQQISTKVQYFFGKKTKKN